MKLTARDMKRLEGVHPDLVRLVTRAAEITLQPFVVSEGLRTPERQAEMVAQKKSLTKNSRHLTGHAVDLLAIVDGKVAQDLDPYRRIAAAMLQASGETGVPVEWGGGWKRLVDGPHFELPRGAYPAPPA